MRRIISVLVENAPGALSRVVGLFSQRGYNIESLTVAPTEDETLSRLTLTTLGDDHKIEQEGGGAGAGGAELEPQVHTFGSHEGAAHRARRLLPVAAEGEAHQASRRRGK